MANKSYPNQKHVVKSEYGIDDAFPANRLEALIETVIDQNEEIVALLQEILEHKKPRKPNKIVGTGSAPQESSK